MSTRHTSPEALLARQAAKRAVIVLGGPSSAARLLNVKGHRHQTVQSWLRTRVPAEYCPDIEAETRERGAPVLCEQLRPDVGWSRIRGHIPAAAEPGASNASQHDDAKGGEAVHAGSLVATVAERATNQTAGELI